MLIGGGVSVTKHIEAIITYLRKHPLISMCFLSAKHLALFDNLPNVRYICLTGNEGARVEKYADSLHNTDSFILSDNNNTDTYVPACAKARTYIVSSSMQFDYADAPLALAMDLFIQISKEKTVLMVGMDGYSESKRSDIYDMMRESQTIIDAYVAQYQFKSLLPTAYQHVEQSSIYAELV